jgi:very-short-patch-repair endonuclease
MEADKALARLGGIADTATLVAATSRRKLRTALASGDIVRVGRGYYALPTAQAARRAAASLSGVASHASAAALWGWKTKHPPALPSVTVPRGRKVSRARREGVDLHHGALSEAERADGVTGRARTVVDCAKVLPFDEALAIADSALQNEDVVPRELLWLAERVRTTGRRQALRVAREADGRAHNPFESVLRAISLDVPGLHLEPQQVIDDGNMRLRPDLLDWERRLVVEADSYGFHSDRAALKRDCERYNELGRLGWTVYRFTWEHVMFEQDYVAEVLAAAVELHPRPVAAATRGPRDLQLPAPKAG